MICMYKCIKIKLCGFRSSHLDQSATPIVENYIDFSRLSFVPLKELQAMDILKLQVIHFKHGNSNNNNDI